MNDPAWAQAPAIAAALALAVLAYTYLGYPLLLALLQWARPLRLRPDPGWQPTVTVCVPAYNAEAVIDRKLASLAALDYPAHRMEILVYSDGSTDRTDALVTAWTARDERVRLIRGATRRGKPTALNVLREEARGEVLLLTDSRPRVERRALAAMLALLADPRVGCVTGNLVLAGDAGSGAYWRYESWIRRAEARFRSMVGMAGTLALLRRADLGLLPADLILDDVWIPMRLRLQGRRIVFCEEALVFDEAFEDQREFGRKVRTLAGNYQLFTWMPRLLLPFANPSWFETFSHKVLRLVCPWALFVLFAASLIGVWSGATPAGSPMLAALLGGQVLFYAGALAGARAGRAGMLARTFVVLNAAAVVGLWRFLARAQRVTW
jgi:cellulose synthase/poly-beta-1,6-N-acetylglucosamine synthase-like glycosyltransferase